jgi:hypothetical protein
MVAGRSCGSGFFAGPLRAVTVAGITPLIGRIRWSARRRLGLPAHSSKALKRDDPILPELLKLDRYRRRASARRDRARRQTKY